MNITRRPPQGLSKAGRGDIHTNAIGLPYTGRRVVGCGLGCVFSFSVFTAFASIILTPNYGYGAPTWTHFGDLATGTPQGHTVLLPSHTPSSIRSSRRPHRRRSASLRRPARTRLAAPAGAVLL